MKIVTLAVIAASIASFALPSLAEARMTHASHSRHMMMRGHHMHMMGRSGGRMAGHRTF